MKITSVNVRKIEKEGSRMKGIASVLLDECFAVHDIRIIEGDNGSLLCTYRHKKSLFSHQTNGQSGINHQFVHEINIDNLLFIILFLSPTFIPSEILIMNLRSSDSIVSATMLYKQPH